MPRSLSYGQKLAKCCAMCYAPYTQALACSAAQQYMRFRRELNLPWAKPRKELAQSAMKEQYASDMETHNGRARSGYGKGAGAGR